MLPRQKSCRSSQAGSTKETSGHTPHAGEPRFSRQYKGPQQSSAPRIEIDFRQLDDGRLVELIEDPEDAAKTKFAVFDKGRVYMADHVSHRGQLFVPRGRQTEGLQDIRLARALNPYRSAEEILCRTRRLITTCVSLSDLHSFVAASFVLYSCFADRLPWAVYLSVTGLPQSGKTTLLQTLGLLCRRSLLVADITRAAANDACSRFAATLLIEENEWQTDRNGRSSRKQLRAGTNRGLLARHLRSTQHAFGAKVLCSIEPPDDPALNSRCIHIPLEESARADLLKPWDPRVIKAADYLQGQLLRFRLERFSSIYPRSVPGAEKLRPRSRDLLSSLIAPLGGEGLWPELLLAFFLGVQDAETQDLLSPAQRAVLAGLHLCIHAAPEGGFVQIGKLTDLANTLLSAAGERFKLVPRKVGHVLSCFGLSSRERASQGWLLCLDQEARRKIHELIRRHGSGYLNEEALKAGTADCIFCRKQDSVEPKEPKRACGRVGGSA